MDEMKRRKTSSIDPINEEMESELVLAIEAIMRREGFPEQHALEIARRIAGLSRDFFTIGNKRKNALGEGFEDLLEILLQRVAQIPADKIKLRTPVSKLSGFRRVAPSRPGEKRKREPHPDIAIVEGDITHVIATAKWSMRQDRETQFQSEYNSFQLNKIQPTELTYVLITNEFDLARLKNVATAMPGSAGGYIFHNIYHICLPLLRQTHGDRFKVIEPWVGTGKLRSLSDFLVEMNGQFGV